MVDAATGEGQAGATLVAEGGGGKEDIAISEENGAFALTLTSVHDKLTIYYNDSQGSGPLRGCGERITIRMTQRPQGQSVFIW